MEPFGHDEVKPAMEYIQKHKQSNDLVYVYSASYPAFDYYADRYDFKAENYIKGKSLRNAPEEFLHELKFESNQRVWFIFTHVHATQKLNHRRSLLNFLNARGKFLDAFVLKTLPYSSPYPAESNISASVYLYQL